MLVVLLALLALSPFLRVNTLVWTGWLQPSEANGRALESAVLGRPLLLVGERALTRSLQLDASRLRLRLRRHLPHTLEVRLEPQRAVARLAEGMAIDAHGRVLAAEHRVDGLPQLVGFELEPNGKRLDARGREMLRQVRALLDTPLLAPSEVRLQGPEMELVLAESGAHVRAEMQSLEAELRKLRIFESSLTDEPLPQSVDLRFRDQIVVRAGERGARATPSRR